MISIQFARRTSVLFLFYMLSFNSTVFAQTKVEIPDTIFRNYLIANFSNTMDGDSLIIDSAAIITGAINCDNLGIADLTGIEYFISISSLDCGYNQLTSLPTMSNMPNLTSFICEKNQLTSLPSMIGMPNLLFLNCWDNNITSLPDLTGLTALRTIWCQNNNITSLGDLSTNTALFILNAAVNLLDSLPNLSNNVLLNELIVENNNLTSLPDLSTLDTLSTLKCRYNNLSILPDISFNINLSWLEFGNNNFTEFPDISSNIKLSNIDCQGNNIVSLPDFSLNPLLNFISAGGNKLTSLPDFSGFSLAYVNVSYNYLDFSDARELRIIDAINPSMSYSYASQYDFDIQSTDSSAIPFLPGDTLILWTNKQDSAISYQWYFNNDSIIGETDTMLIIYNLDITNHGQYYCEARGTALSMPPMINGPGITTFKSEVISYNFNSTGIKKIGHKKSIKVYPNPSDGIINIKTDIQNGIKASYSIINIEGKVVAKNYTWISGESIDVSSLTPGLYEIQIQSDNNFFNASVVIK